MAGNQSDLYRWKRITSKNKPVASVTKKSSKPTDDIQDWIKKVEEASNQAAAVTFGLPARGQRANGYSTVEATLDAVHDHDEAYSEAQDLLSQWMAEKCNLDDPVTMYDEDENEGALQGSTEVRSALRSEWDDMLERHDPMLVSKTKYTTSDELYADIESRDDYSTVQNILGSLMEKELMAPKQKKKLQLASEEKKKTDPRTTMAARQQKVKENRQKKELERKQQLEARQAKKTAQLQARQMVQQEEKEKAMKIQREEQMIREEMMRIRKELQEQKRLEEEARTREKAILAEARREEDERQRKKELVMRKIENARQQQIDKDRRAKEERMIRDAQEARRLKTLQSHFHAWYRLVQDHRLQMGKARALSEWRCLLKSWNAWRAFVRACRAEREAKQTEMEIELSHRRKIVAENHYRHHLLQKTFVAWQVYCHKESQEKEYNEQQSQRRSKMAAFLDAAASGKLWTNRGQEEELTPRSGRPVSAGRVMGANFDGGDGYDPISSRSDPSSRPGSTHTRQEKGTRHQSSRKPKHAWQVTRKHVNLTAEEIASIGDNMDAALVDSPTSGQPPSGVKHSKEGKKPIQYTVNNFEHRYSAQQKLLAEQQEQLREQRRLIEELQLGQKQQAMKKQLEQIQDGEYSQDLEEHPGGHPLDNMFNRGQRSARSDLSTGDSTSRTNWSEESASSNRTRSTSRSQPPILKGMEERAAQRAKLKAEREERHKQRERQKLKEMQEEEERKVAAEEAEKKAAIEKRREEKRLAKQREQEKLDRIEKSRRQMAQADAHYQSSLLRHYGFKPWCKLVHMSRQNMQVAIDHHSHNLLHTVLLSWHHMTQEVIQRKNDLADVRFKEILLRRSFNSWKRFGHYQSIQLQKARRHYLHRLKSKALLQWRDWVTDERIRAWQAEERAEEHDTRRIMKTAFRAWRRYPRMLKEERAKEIRRQEMRRKVASIIPDFGLT
ncbi:coiled-coil domain-containing protein 191-like [Lytechinus variegatus]|uniref:coiled-coil domain-containing protein 191-like n=1 Tax=Lytechinus variegatus TaxID=7654 RepID=UPI001BB10A0D|nr:coiled-coil domain-containing protein 191-like [Lytechinus variegatus]